MSNQVHEKIDNQADEDLGIEELSEEDLENVAGGWNGDDNGGG